MEKFNKKGGFAYFGAIQKNERWSWAAATPKKDKVVITLWDHELKGERPDSYYDTRELPDIRSEDWQKKPGNTDRIKLLKHAQENLDGVLYVLMLKAIDENEQPRKKIENTYPWSSTINDYRVKLTFLDENTGDYRVEFLDSVRKKDFVVGKVQRGNAGQFFVAGELCRRGLIAVVTMGNTPNTDVLCSNVEGTKFVHIQVKTFRPNARTCTVGKKAETNNGKNFIWVLCGLPEAGDDAQPEFFIIPSPILSQQVSSAHRKWLRGKTPKGDARKSGVRTVSIPPHVSYTGWSVEDYRNRWDIIENLV